jgi:hypothetical protein
MTFTQRRNPTAEHSTASQAREEMRGALIMGTAAGGIFQKAGAIGLRMAG